MKLNLIGHSYKYAVEQIMLALFPGERPEYEDSQRLTAQATPHAQTAAQHEQGISAQAAPHAQTAQAHEQDPASAISAKSVLVHGGTYVQAITTIERSGEKSRGTARVNRSKLTDRLMTDRLLQRIVKQSFFRAAVTFISEPPVWGALTGIRPAKIAENAILSGASRKAAARVLVNEYYVSPERAHMCVDAAQSALAIKETVEVNDVAVYIGIPFCPTRCAYCSFVSNSVEKSFTLIEPFTETLLYEISEAAKAVREYGLRVISVYIGGGTPTSLPDANLEIIMRAVNDSFDLSSVREYTVEAGRPDTITRGKLEIIRTMGAGRVCVNPQSMSAEVLLAIGRKHTPEHVIDAVNEVRRFGFTLNMDVIAGLPEDSPGGFALTLDTVLGCCPENVTVHTLSKKKGSRLMLDGTETPDGVAVARMLGYASDKLRSRNYAPYYLYRQKFTSGGFENTGWSLPGCECIYNVCMMEELCTVISLGGGGVTKLVTPGGRIERIFNAKYPREYIMHSDKVKDKFKRIREIAPVRM